VSSVKESDAVPVGPAALVWLATMVCVPSARPVGVNDHTPLASAFAVAAIEQPSIVKPTTALASAVPTRAGLALMRSLREAPVSLARRSVTMGGAAVVSIFRTPVGL
jgi:hypothetical protein